MRRSLLLLLLAMLLFGGNPRSVPAQPRTEPAPARAAARSRAEALPSPPRSRSVGPSRSQLSVWIGHSVGAGLVLGTIRKGRVGLLGLRYARVLLPAPSQNPRSYDGPSLTYTADLVPAARLRIPVDAMPDRIYRTDEPRTTGLSTYGYGGYPLGLRLTFRPRHRVRPFLAGETGALYFSEAVPDSRGRQLNFAAGIGAGLQVSLAGRTTMTIGYRYHHLSNGFRGSINPGIDANVLYLGVGADL